MAVGKRILLYGMYGSINVGDELVCYSMVRGLEAIVKNPQIWVASLNERKSQEFQCLPEVNFYQGRCFHYTFWLHLINILKKVRQVDGVIIGGGGLLQDQYSWRLPGGSVWMAALSVLMGKATFILGVGVGPLRRKWLRRALYRILPSVDQICVRDQQSYRVLQDIGLAMDNIQVTADIVPSIDLYRESFLKKKISRDQKLIAIILRDWPGIDNKSLATLLEILVNEGHKIHLHCFEPDHDSVFYENVLSHCSAAVKANIKKIIPQKLSETIESINQSAFVISMRLHGCILAVGLDVPLLPVVYESKVRSFMRQMGMEDLVHEVRDIGPGLITEMARVKEYWDNNPEERYDRYRQIKLNADKNFECIKNKLMSMKNRSRFRSVSPKVYIGLWWLTLRALMGEIYHIMTFPWRSYCRK
ncbi:MAG: polysaccharide pyruvyl transferase family protein [Sedimentisphaerales bacterium]|nr:polysaccharide pyruvyl transferase family protein [Sedimentisphaerales bacterium]